MDIEVVNEKYYDNDVVHRITFAISNAINPTFDVWATHLQSALEELMEYAIEKGYEGLYYTMEEAQELSDSEDDIDENFFAVDGQHFFDMDRIYCEVQNEIKA